MRVLYLTNDDAFFVSHRLALGEAVRRRGHEVVVAASEKGGRERIERAGLRFEPVPFDRGGRSVTRDARTLAALVALYRRVKPDLVHHVTIKPVLYGSLAAKVTGVRAVVNAISGLGYVFIPRERFSARHALLRAAVEQTYRVALAGRSVRVIFQNPDDRGLFVSRGLVSASRTVLIRGAGVDTMRFAPSPVPSGEPLVVLPARLLWDKGVGEFVEAARSLRAQGVRARFVLVGGLHDTNPARIERAQVDAWVREGAVEWWDHCDDMPSVLAQSALVVLPSYREGMPLALAEAAACARACVTADVPGCREIVHHGDNGWCVPVRDAVALAGAIREALSDRDELVRRGARGRARVEAEFSQTRVIEDTLGVYAQLGARL